MDKIIFRIVNELLNAGLIVSGVQVSQIEELVADAIKVAEKEIAEKQIKATSYKVMPIDNNFDVLDTRPLPAARRVATFYPWPNCYFAKKQADKLCDELNTQRGSIEAK